MKESYRRFKWDVFPAYEWKDWLDKKTGKPLVWPPGDSAGFESPAAVEKAWQQYGEKKKVGLVLGKVLGSGSPRTYSPMSSEHATLFKTFADLDYMDREAILGFATNFGFLGLDPQQQDVFPGPSGDAHIVSGESHLSWAREICLMREPAHPFLRSADSLDPQLRPGLPVPFAMKGRRFEHPANVADQDVVRGRADRPAAPTRHLGRCRLPPRVDAGASAVPHPAAPLQAVRPTRRDRVTAPHRLDLRRAKGPPASSWSTFAYTHSFSISSSPILACSRRSSSFRASGGRLFRLAWPAARHRSRHCEARAAVIPTARDTDSRSSPRNRRSTTSRFRPTDNRPPRPGSAASPVALRAPSAAADP